MTEWVRGNELEKQQAAGDLEMRLGAYRADLKRGSRMRQRTARPRSSSVPSSPL